MQPSPLAFSHLKCLVSIAWGLTARGAMTSLKQRGQRLIGPGPVHHGDYPQALGVKPSKQLWYGFTPCRAGGDGGALVQRMAHCHYPELARYLASLAQLWPNSASAEATAVLVECPWGVMRLAQIGIPAVVLLGIPFSRTQVPHPTNRPYPRWRPDLDPHDLANLELSCRLLPLLP
jgi:DNA primase